MEERRYSSDLNIQFNKANVNYIKPDKLYLTIDVIKERHGKFEVTVFSHGPRRYLLPAGIVDVFSEWCEDTFPEIRVHSRTLTGLKKIVTSLSLPIGHTPKDKPNSEE